MSFKDVFNIENAQISYWAAKAKGGDKKAFAKLYDRLAERIYRFILVRVGSSEDAEDLTAVTFTKALENIENFKGKDLSFLAWIYRIARNTVIDYYRKKKNSQIPLDEVFDLGQEDGTVEKLDGEYRQKLVWSAIGKLAKNHQEIVIWKFIEELSYKDIGSILGKKEGAVRILCFRALKKLRRNLDGKI